MENIVTNKLSSIVIAIDEFAADVSALELVSSFFRIYRESDNICTCSFHKDGEEMMITINKRTNLIYVNDEPMDFFSFIKLVDPSLNCTSYLETVSGLDSFDYISEVIFENGFTQMIDVKGKNKLRGMWMEKNVNELTPYNYVRLLNKLGEMRAYVA